jgi:ketosteroid isomerase-like protein
MSTPATKPTHISDLEHELNQTIIKGDFVKAFDKFYADNVVMQQNDESPVAGKEANRKREEEFMKSVEHFHGAKLLGDAVTGDVAFSEWEYDMTVKGRGRAKMCEVAVRHWKNGQVAKERFYYKAM